MSCLSFILTLGILFVMTNFGKNLPILLILKKQLFVLLIPTLVSFPKFDWFLLLCWLFLFFSLYYTQVFFFNAVISYISLFVSVYICWLYFLLSSKCFLVFHLSSSLTRYLQTWYYSFHYYYGLKNKFYNFSMLNFLRFVLNQWAIWTWKECIFCYLLNSASHLLTYRVVQPF